MTVDTDYYTNCFTPHPHDPEMRILFSAMFHHSTDTTDIRLAVSTDGRFFEWVSREPVIDNFDAECNFYSQVYAYPTLIPIGGEDVGLLFSRHENGHDDWSGDMYGKEFESHYSMAFWKSDRLAGVKISQTGEFYTDLNLKSGRLQINFRTLSPKGYVTVALQDKNTPIEGFSLNDSAILTGDCNWVDCSWNGNKDLALLPSMDCKIRIHSESAIIYGIRVIAQEDTEINTKTTYNAI